MACSAAQTTTASSVAAAGLTINVADVSQAVQNIAMFFMIVANVSTVSGLVM